MTIAAGIDKDVYSGDGSKTEWPITFSVAGLSASEIYVYKTATSGVSTRLTTNFSVDLTVPAVTYPVSGTKLQSGEQIVLIPMVTIKQASNYTNQGGVPPEVLEADLDRIIRISKQLDEKIARTPVADISASTFDATVLIASAQDAANLAETAKDGATVAQAAAEAAQKLAEDARDAAVAVAGWEVANATEAAAGTDNTKVMTPLRVFQSIAVFYPVGSIYLNATDNTNPGTLLGFGTWEALGAGRVLVGFNAADGDFDTAEKTGGAKTHTLTTDELAAHTHTASIVTLNSGSSGGAAASGTCTYNATNSTGGGQAHNNLQPYITVFIWKRTV